MSGDRWIKVVECQIKEPTAIGVAERVMAGFRVSEDKETLFTTTADWLCGNNTWGLHNDLSFAAPVAKTRACNRIIDAAEEVQKKITEARKEKGGKDLPLVDLFPEGLWIKVSAADYEQEIKRVLEHPQPHPNAIPQPTGISRAILPIYEAIEGAVSEDPDKPKEEPKTEEKGAEAEEKAE